MFKYFSFKLNVLCPGLNKMVWEKTYLSETKSGIISGKLKLKQCIASRFNKPAEKLFIFKVKITNYKECKHLFRALELAVLGRYTWYIVIFTTRT